MDKNKTHTLPKDINSDYSLPGRLEESNSEDFNSDTAQPKFNLKVFLIIIISFIVISSTFFSLYFLNQNEIDSQIIENTLDSEQILSNKYDIGEYGSDHAHAVIVVIVNNTKLNFGLPQFQLTSKFIHFENGNSYLIHKHATGVPLEMLFSSFGMDITSDCIFLKSDSTSYVKTKKFCIQGNQYLSYYVNGKEYNSDITQYEINNNDRILISLGNMDSIPKQLKHLESLEIFDIPNKTPPSSVKEFTV